MERLRNVWNSFSFVGLVIAILFFAVSVTPSLLPRTPWTQGALSGFALAVGYGIGVLLYWIYRFYQLPEVPGGAQLRAKFAIGVVLVFVFVGFLWRITVWQNSIRSRMEMPELETAYPFRMVLVALVVGGVLVLLTRAFIWLNLFVGDKLSRWLPRRVARTLGFVVVCFAVMTLTNDVLMSRLLATTDQVFARIDQTFDEDFDIAKLPAGIGDPASVIAWDEVGKQGKSFLVAGPTKTEIARFWKRPAMSPVRVYAGLNSADSYDQRAAAALEELIRVGGFERSVLVVATPTGTGWLDPAAVDTLEYLHGGDTAIVSMQYSYLPSWLTILVDPQRSKQSAEALFQAVYEHWKTLDHDRRPRLYLQGLSLGAFGGEASAPWYTILEDPIHGAVYSGTPFPSQQWQQLVANRNPGTTPWQPGIGDGRNVRFTTQTNALGDGAPWGSIRVVYIQHASDPMVWFSPSLAWQQPEWLSGQRGPDVSPLLRWYPIITFLQIAFDLPMATSVPAGYGHNYAANAYIDAWLAVTQPPDWDETKTARLKALFLRQQGAAGPSLVQSDNSLREERSPNVALAL